MKACFIVLINFFIGYAIIQLPEFLLFVYKKFANFQDLRGVKTSSSDILSRTSTSSKNATENNLETLEVMKRMSKIEKAFLRRFNEDFDGEK